MRGAALASLAWLWEPSIDSLDYLVALSGGQNMELLAACPDAIWRFALRCKRRVAYLRAVSGKLDELRDAAVELARTKSTTQQAQSDFSRLREALAELTNIKIAYEEYAARQTIHPSGHSTRRV